MSTPFRSNERSSFSNPFRSDEQPSRRQQRSIDRIRGDSSPSSGSSSPSRSSSSGGSGFTRGSDLPESQREVPSERQQRAIREAGFDTDDFVPRSRSPSVSFARSPTQTGRLIPVSEGFASRVEQDVASGDLERAQRDIEFARASRRADAVGGGGFSTADGGFGVSTVDFVTEQRVPTPSTRTERFAQGVSQGFNNPFRAITAQTRSTQSDFSPVGDSPFIDSGSVGRGGLSRQPSFVDPVMRSGEIVGVAGSAAGGFAAGRLFRFGINRLGRRFPTTALATQRGVTGLGGGFFAAQTADRIVRADNTLDRLDIGTQAALGGAGFASGARGTGITIGRPQGTASIPSSSNVGAPRGTRQGDIAGGFVRQETVPVTTFGTQFSTQRLTSVSFVGTRTSPSSPNLRAGVNVVTQQPIPGVRGRPDFSITRSGSLRGTITPSGDVTLFGRREAFASSPIVTQQLISDGVASVTRQTSSFANVRGTPFGLRAQRGVSQELFGQVPVNIPQVSVASRPGVSAFAIRDRPRVAQSVSSRILSSEQASVPPPNTIRFDPTGGLSALARPSPRSVIGRFRPSTRVSGRPSFTGLSPRSIPRLRTPSLFASASAPATTSAISSRLNNLFSQGTSTSSLLGVSARTGTSTTTDTQLVTQSITDTGLITTSTQRTSPVTIPRPVPRTPPPSIFIPPSLGIPNFGLSGLREGRRGSRGREEEFTPSIVANVFNLRGSRRSRVSTGLEIRRISN